MAKQCCVCSKKFTMFETGTPIHSKYPEYELCFSCQQKYRDLEYTSDANEREKLFKHFSHLISSKTTPDEVKIKFTDIQKRVNKRKEDVAEKQRKELDYQARFADMLLATCQTLDGYSVKQYCGVVSTDILFRNGLQAVLGTIGKSLEETDQETKVVVLGYHSVEYGMVSELVDKAKEHAYTKIKRKAADLGANCVMGMTVEATFFMPGNGHIVNGASLAEWVKVSVTGTAALIEKVSN